MRWGVINIDISEKIRQRMWECRSVGIIELENRHVQECIACALIGYTCGCESSLLGMLVNFCSYEAFLHYLYRDRVYNPVEISQNLDLPYYLVDIS